MSCLHRVVEPRRASALTRLALVAVYLGATACVHRAQVWPSPLAPGKQVTARFSWPRAIALDDDSLLVVKEMSGSVIAFHGDTLVIRLTSVPEQPRRGVWRGHVATVPLDSATTVTHAEFDESVVALMAVAGIAFVYAFIGSLPP